MRQLLLYSSLFGDPPKRAMVHAAAHFVSWGVDPTQLDSPRESASEKSLFFGTGVSSERCVFVEILREFKERRDSRESPECGEQS